MIYITDDDFLQMRYHAKAGGDVLQLADEMGYPVNMDLVKLLFEELIFIKDFHKVKIIRLKLDKADENGIGAYVRNKVRELYTTDSFAGAAISHYYKQDPRVSSVDKTHPEYVTKQIKLPYWMATIVEHTDLILSRNRHDLDQVKLRPIDEERKLKGTLSVDHYGGYPTD